MQPFTVVHNQNELIYFMNWAYQWAIIPAHWMYENESYFVSHKNDKYFSGAKNAKMSQNSSIVTIQKSEFTNPYETHRQFLW